MDPRKIRVGGCYAGGDSAYQIDEITGDEMQHPSMRRVSGIILRADRLPRRKIGARRHRFCSLEMFARWAEREERPA